MVANEEVVDMFTFESPENAKSSEFWTLRSLSLRFCGQLVIRFSTHIAEIRREV